MKKAVCYDDVLLIPQMSDITSRKDIDLSSSLGDFNFMLPIISSPMDTVTEAQMARSMNAAGGLGIIHRYNTVAEQVRLVKDAQLPFTTGCIGAAIGVSGDYIDRAMALYEAGANIICVDIAHGHHALMRNALATLRNTFGSVFHIMAGNVATLEGFNALADWGADSIRVGVGGGSICSTRIQTGHGMPSLQSILDCSRSDRNVALIADGGIKTSGDIVKALAAGADFVMLGSLLAGTQQASGEIVHEHGERYKEYRGMASKEAQIDWRGHYASLEGVTSRVPFKGSVRKILEELECGIRSGLSYSGAKNIKEFHSKSQFLKQSSSGFVEGTTHIKSCN